MYTAAHALTQCHVYYFLEAGAGGGGVDSQGDPPPPPLRAIDIIFTHMHAHTHAHARMHTHVRTHACTHERIHIHTITHTVMHTLTHTHTKSLIHCVYIPDVDVGAESELATSITLYGLSSAMLSSRPRLALELDTAAPEPDIPVLD